MRENFSHSPGIVILNEPSSQNQRFLHIFTREFGIVHCRVNGVSKSRSDLVAGVSALSCSNFIFKGIEESPCTLYDLEETYLFPGLRADSTRLRLAGGLVNLIKRSQLPLSPAKALYQLLFAYLKRMEISTNPLALFCSFQLKSLIFEGLIELSPTCTLCESLPSCTMSEGQSICHDCLIESPPLVEWTSALTLGLSRDFTLLEATSVNESLYTFIMSIVEESRMTLH